MAMPPFAVAPLDSAQRDEAVGFVRSWNHADRHDRFGNASPAAAEWLAARLCATENRGAFIARDGAEMIALLDYATFEASAEIGVFVRGADRRRGIARCLFEAFLEALPRRTTLRGYCRYGNSAARAFLQACGFACTSGIANELDWERVHVPHARRSDARIDAGSEQDAKARLRL